jgi:molecular chaperone DnaK
MDAHDDVIIGIDLGTTYSCAAYVDKNDKVQLIPYRGGEYTVPSIFAIDNKGTELVGYEAKRQWQLNPQNTIYGTKRLIGQSFDSEIVARMKEYVAYEMQAGPNNDIVIPVRGRTFSLPEISGRTLAKIKDVAAKHFGRPIERAVVTVPAYFNDRQRQAVKEAGRLAGVDVVRIINEPTSAALAYGAGKGREELVAVFDLGGGTFDISVIELRNQVFEVKATGGDIFLGGLDFDKEIITYVLNEFQGQHSVDLSGDPVAMQRIKDMAEQVKINLSVRTEDRFQLPFITMTPSGQPVDLDVMVTRADYEELVTPLVDRCLDTCATVILDAGIKPHDITEVLLVGGQTRMPLVQKRITNFFGKQPSKGVHPDEAVAIGAALYANSLRDASSLKLQLLDVIPMAIGIEDASGAMRKLFPRNAPVPNQKTFEFTTSHDDQDHLMMRMFQGDKEMACDNQLLGEFTFAGIRSGPRGTVRVETVLTLNIEGILSLEAHDLDTGVQMERHISIGGLGENRNA